MLYRAGTKREILELSDVLHERVIEELINCTSALDYEYGEDRDYLEVGGYSLIAESSEDMAKVKESVDYDVHPCEWANRLGGGSGYFSALYLMNNEFSIVVFMPEYLAPDDVIENIYE